MRPGFSATDTRINGASGNKKDASAGLCSSDIPLGAARQASTPALWSRICDACLKDCVRALKDILATREAIAPKRF